MRKDVADEWVAALRSGEYKQTTGFLSRFDPRDPLDRTHCCLGVQCEIAVKHGVIDYGDDDTTWYHGTYGDGVDTDLPDEVFEWAGIKSETPMVFATVSDPEYGERRIHVALIDLNDVHGFTFEQIADLIEEQWEDM